MKKALGMGVVLSAGLGGAYYLFAPDEYRPLVMKSEFEQFCLQCENVLRERLRSPSSYLRLECAGPYTEVADREAYLRHDRSTVWNDVSDWVREQIENEELFITTAFLRYEAANGFGASIAGLEACTSDHRESQSYLSAAGITGPNVGGFSNTTWVIHQLTRD
jgi:hypothetical protein